MLIMFQRATSNNPLLPDINLARYYQFIYFEHCNLHDTFYPIPFPSTRTTQLDAKHVHVLTLFCKVFEEAVSKRGALLIDSVTCADSDISVTNHSLVHRVTLSAPRGRWGGGWYSV